jgi:hypothetical protein
MAKKKEKKRKEQKKKKKWKEKLWKENEKIKNRKKLSNNERKDENKQCAFLYSEFALQVSGPYSGPNSEVLTRMWVGLWGHAGKTSCFQNVGQYFNRQCKHLVRKSHCKQTVVTGLQRCCAVLPNIFVVLAARQGEERACTVEIGIYLLGGHN